MSQSVRQSNLFAARDWKKIYRSFLQVNFVSYDFDTIRKSLIDYIRLNYPEDFNDFIDSSEFIAIIDILAWLGESLAFRTDLNVRENFLDTAERRESIIRLAQLLSYKPKRNIPARGFLKITGLQMNSDVYDSNGNNLNGIRINWNDPNNPDWYRQFVLILNDIFVKSNRFGQPIASGNDFQNVRFQVYELDSIPTQNAGVYRFSKNIDGRQLPFEIVPISFKENEGFIRQDPDFYGKMSLIYKNDGKGNSSQNTGFFVMFKQGTLQYQDFNITVPVRNRIIDINVNNINEFDVWVQNVDTDGKILKRWIKVPSTINGNIIYNNIPRKERNIFSVRTRAGDQISIRFPDGRFGNVAFGLTRIYYRQSFGEKVILRPNDIKNITINVEYINKAGLRKSATFYCSLEETITNAESQEPDIDIKTNAAQVYYTQNRMVTGEDYNSFPLQFPQVRKIKAINRIYSGHNRYVDINDPTGYLQNTNVIGDDGILYKRNFIFTRQIDVNKFATPVEKIISVVVDEMNKIYFRDFLIDAVKNNAPTCIDFQNLFVVPPLFGPGNVGIMWDRITGNGTNTTGRFVPKGSIPVSISTQALAVSNSYPANDSLDIIKEGSLIKFKNAGWVYVSGVIGNGKGPIPGAIGEGFTLDGKGMVRLTGDVKEGDRLISVLPPIRTNLSKIEIQSIKSKMQFSSTFAIFYNIKKDFWEILDVPVTPPAVGFKYDEDFDYCDIQRKWMVVFRKNAIGGQTWNIHFRGLRYIFESEEDVRFFFLNKYRVVDKYTGRSSFDTIKILKINEKPEFSYNVYDNWTSGKSYFYGDFVKYANSVYQSIVSGTNSNFFDRNEWKEVCSSLNRDYDLKIVDSFIYNDGHIEPRKVIVSFTDTNFDGVPDNPEAFDDILYGTLPKDIVTEGNLLFWEKYTSFDNYEYYKPVSNIKIFIRNTFLSALNSMDNNYRNISTKTEWKDGDISFVYSTQSSKEQFYLFDIDDVYVSGDLIPPGYDIGDIKKPSDQKVLLNKELIREVGRNDLYFVWKHYAPFDHRIDPAITNIIDIYVLTSEYDDLYRKYVRGEINEPPKEPTIGYLEELFKEVEEFKMITDQIIWHPVKYKLLFCDKSIPQLRAKIKVVKLSNSNMSDGEIKTRIIELVNNYFSVENWNFGDTFYFSELAAFIHQNLALHVASVVLVPVDRNSSFGNLYEVKCEPDRIFLGCVTVDDIDIIRSNTQVALKIK